MRSREEILKSAGDATVELLLDIRDLLANPEHTREAERIRKAIEEEKQLEKFRAGQGSQWDLRCVSFGCGHFESRHVTKGGSHPCMDCYNCRGYTPPERAF